LAIGVTNFAAKREPFCWTKAHA